MFAERPWIHYKTPHRSAESDPWFTFECTFVGVPGAAGEVSAGMDRLTEVLMEAEELQQSWLRVRDASVGGSLTHGIIDVMLDAQGKTREHAESVFRRVVQSAMRRAIPDRVGVRMSGGVRLLPS